MELILLELLQQIASRLLTVVIHEGLRVVGEAARIEGRPAARVFSRGLQVDDRLHSSSAGRNTVRYSTAVCGSRVWQKKKKKKDLSRAEYLCTYSLNCPMMSYCSITWLLGRAIAKMLSVILQPRHNQTKHVVFSWCCCRENIKLHSRLDCRGTGTVKTSVTVQRIHVESFDRYTKTRHRGWRFKVRIFQHK